MNRGLWIYDCEVLPYFFSYTALNIDTKKVVQFQISSLKNEIKELVWHLTNEVKGQIGYNNIGYDSFLINYILNASNAFNTSAFSITTELNNLSNSIVNSEVKMYGNSKIPQQDLYLMYHYNSNAKATSLKWIEFMMDFHNIQDVDWKDLQGQLSEEQISLILEYNLNDVNATYELYKNSTNLITTRREISTEYGLNLMSASEPRIVKEVFGWYLCRALGITYKELKEMRTERGILYPKDFILPEASFDTEIFKDVLETFNKLEITSTKGSFEKEINWKDCTIKYALGGIHGAVKSGVYESNEDYVILSLDVRSFYPNLAIKHKWSPAHFDKQTFCDIYEGFYKERLKYPKDDPRNYLFKIILNSAYGLSNEENSYLYDSLFTMQITINGQLLLSKLLESISLEIDIKPLLINTDGAELYLKRSDLPSVMRICKEWENITNLELEFLNYDKLIIKDVNNYIAIDEHKKVKSKGLFEWKKLPYHKNKSYAIIPKALEEYFINNIPVKETIEKEDDIFKFCRGIKSKKGSWFEFYQLKDNKLNTYKLQKVNRFYISKKGGKVIKHYEDGRKSFIEAKKCNEYIYNNINTDLIDHLNNVNRSYYIIECNNIINSIIKKQITLYE